MDAFYEMNIKSSNNWSKPNSMMARASMMVNISITLVQFKAIFIPFIWYHLGSDLFAVWSYGYFFGVVLIIKGSILRLF